MVKVIIRETIIALLVCLAVLLLLSVALYNYIPTNKVVPEVIQYEPSKEVKNQLNTEVKDDSEEILMTYEITANDLDNYERIDEYNPGKANPFAPVSENVDGDGGNIDGSGNTSTDPINPSNGSSNNGSSGSLFENGSSK